jgi:hypothetical protein
MIGMLKNPFGLMILGLTALLLLIDDFNTFKKGGVSEFPELWKWFTDLGKQMDESGTGLKTFKDDIFDIVGSLGELGKTIGELTGTLDEDGKFSKSLKDGVISTLKDLDNLLKGINKGLRELNGLLKGEGYYSFSDIVTGQDKEDARVEEETGVNPKYKRKEQEQEDKQNGVPEQSYSLGEFWKDVKNFFKNYPTEFMGNTVAISYPVNHYSYMYPKTNSAVTTTNNINMSPNYNIKEASNANSTVAKINYTNIALITRAVKGVNR